MPVPRSDDFIPPAPPVVGGARDRDRDGDIDANDVRIGADVRAVSKKAHKLSEKMASRVELDEEGIPRQINWKPTISWKAMAAGAIADVAVELILQQLGLVFLDSRDLLEGIVQGSLLGAAAPMLGNLVGVLWVNQKIGKLRAEVAG